MAISINFDEYKREIELTIKQNPLECELYSLIAVVLRSCKNSNKYSFRDVSFLRYKGEEVEKRLKITDRQYKFFENNTEKYGSPDFVVLSPQYSFSDNDERKKLIFGCIEVKAIFEKLERTFQLDRELESFGKVLYANGLEWYYHEKGKEAKKWIIGNYNNKNPNYISANDYIEWEDESKWEELIKGLEEISWEE